ncbi:MAG: helix-turn-helix domain-containing protein [Erysipelotrichaceae bacterium]|nr:helix-turn-helix domain-containing protein [Erysipelotrichaceae bacterium]
MSPIWGSHQFFPNFIRVTFPFNKDKFREKIEEITELTETQKSIISIMLDSPTITQETLSKLLGVNIRTIQRNIKTFIEMELIERIGATKKENG